MREGEAAKALVAVLGEVAGDDDLAADMIEGETGLFEAVDAALTRLLEIEAFDGGLHEQAKRIIARRDRLDRQADSIRTALMMAMDAAGLRKIERPVATLSISRTQPKLIVTNEADIPAGYWERGAPKLDKKRLLAEMKGGQNIPGVTLSNAGETIVVRVS
jgi:hypothetical protein